MHMPPLLEMKKKVACFRVVFDLSSTIGPDCWVSAKTFWNIFFFWLSILYEKRSTSKDSDIYKMKKWRFFP